MSVKNENKRPLVPKLRFPEFQEAGGWEEEQLNQIADPVMGKATEKDSNTVLTLSGEYGLVMQDDYFGKKVAGDDVSRYIRIIRNDFVYNDRTTTLSTYGTIKRLSQYQSGIVSPIYKCFRFKEEEIPDFWEKYFESGTHESQLSDLVNEGARAGRFNISIQKFLSTHAIHPKPIEQQKIADCLSAIDERITVETRKLDALKANKKGLLKQLFPADGETVPQLRFPDFNNTWIKSKLEFFCNNNISSGKDYSIPNGKYDLHGSTGIIGKTSESTYCGKFILVARVGANAGFLTRVNGKFGVTDNTLVVQLKQTVNFDFIFYNLISQNINNNSFGSGQPLITGSQLKNFPLFIPSDEWEQQKIADCLSSLDKLITTQSQKIDLLKTHKKGLLQQLFPSADEAKA